MEKIILRTIVVFAIFTSCVSSNGDQLQNINGKSLNSSEIDGFITGLMDSLKIPGLSIAIINDSQVVYKGLFGLENINTNDSVTDQTIFEAASMSKPVFAYFVMKQVDKGIFELDKPLYQYLLNPDIVYDERYKRITGRMILSHTSGFPNWREDTGDTLILLFDPGTKFEYSGEGYQYLKDVMTSILKTNDRGLDSIFQLEVSKPIGATYLHYTRNDERNKLKAMGHWEGKAADSWTDGPPDLFGAAWSLQTTASDYSKFLIALLNKKGITESSLNEMITEQVIAPNDWDESHWSLGFGITHTMYGTKVSHSGHNGDFTAYSHLYPDKGYGIAIFCNSDNLFSSEFVKKLLFFLGEETK